MGRRRAMLRRWKKDILLMFLMCDLKGRVGSRMTPRFRTRGEGVTVCPSMHSEKSWVEGRWDLGPVMMISDLLQLSLRKLLFIRVGYRNSVPNENR